MNYLFLDVDGVLNKPSTKATSPSGALGVDENLVCLLKKLVDTFDYKIVLTSSWRKEVSLKYEECTKDGKYLVDTLRKYGLEIYDKTLYKERLEPFRGRLILDWLEEKGKDCNRFIILDDFEFDFDRFEKLKPLVIQTRALDNPRAMFKEGQNFIVKETIHVLLDEQKRLKKEGRTK